MDNRHMKYVGRIKRHSISMETINRRKRSERSTTFASEKITSRGAEQWFIRVQQGQEMESVWDTLWRWCLTDWSSSVCTLSNGVDVKISFHISKAFVLCITIYVLCIILIFHQTFQHHLYHVLYVLTRICSCRFWSSYNSLTRASLIIGTQRSWLIIIFTIYSN